MRYRLSKLVPMRFTSEYRDHGTSDNPRDERVRSTWWQWRGRIWRHHLAIVTTTTHVA